MSGNITQRGLSRFPALEFCFHGWRAVSRWAVGPVMCVDAALIGTVSAVFTGELGCRVHLRL